AEIGDRLSAPAEAWIEAAVRRVAADSELSRVSPSAGATRRAGDDELAVLLKRELPEALRHSRYTADPEARVELAVGGVAKEHRADRTGASSEDDPAIC